MSIISNQINMQASKALDGAVPQVDPTKLKPQDAQASENLSAHDRKKIHEAAQQFEAIFLQLMLKSMRSTVPKSEFMNGGNSEDIYRSMLDNEYAKTMAAQENSGLAGMIEKELLKKMGIDQKLQADITQKTGTKLYQAQALQSK